MPAQSKQQQKFMGIVRAIQKGDAPASKFSKAARDAAKDMSKSDVKKYAKTKHKGLPRKVKQELLNRLKKEYAFYHTGTQSRKRDHDDDNNLGKKKKHSGQPDIEEKKKRLHPDYSQPDPYNENVVKNHDGKAAPYGSGYKKVGDEEINEVGVFPIQNYLSGIIPPGRLDVVKKGDKEKAIALIKDLVFTLNDFWKSHKIPFRVREPRKSDMNKFKKKTKRF
tara:strand:+ start:1214 stop:1879 length:666 start_codon:yes stop_codon:yes gene_type:complete